jgi:tetratricopeptide (TPR) repeat protein
LSETVSLQFLDDSDPQVRVAAISNLQGRLDAQRLVMSLVPLLNDPLRVVRTEAARVLATVPASAMRGAERKQLKDVLAEFEKGMMLSNDRAAAHMTMGILYESLGEDDRALEAYETGIQVEPTATGPRTNLAALCDRLAEAADGKARQAALLGNRKSESEAVRTAVDYRERAAKLRREELEWLERDAKLVPNSASVQYRYGMSLYLHRRLDEAERALVSASQLEPNNPQFLLGVVLFYKEMNQPDKAIPLAERLVQLRPRDAMFRQVLEEIRRQKEARSPAEP